MWTERKSSIFAPTPAFRRPFQKSPTSYFHPNVDHGEVLARSPFTGLRVTIQNVCLPISEGQDVLQPPSFEGDGEQRHSNCWIPLRWYRKSFSIPFSPVPCNVPSCSDGKNKLMRVAMLLREWARNSFNVSSTNLLRLRSKSISLFLPFSLCVWLFIAFLIIRF